MAFMDAAQWVAILGLAGLIGLLFWITNKQINKIDRLRSHRHRHADGEVIDHDVDPAE